MLSKTVLAAAACVLASANAIWPVPQNISTGEKVLFMDQTVPVTYNGQAVRWTPPDASDRDEAVQPDAET